MTADGSDFPREVDFLPDEPLEMSFLRSFRDGNRVRDVWIRRYHSLDDVECADGDYWNLSLGFVPTVDIEEFVVERADGVATFVFTDEGWELTAAVGRDDIEGQLFAHRMKPYVTISRATTQKESEEMATRD